MADDVRAGGRLWFHIGVFAVGVLLLGANAALIWAEAGWSAKNKPGADPYAAFVHSSTGTELAPKVVFEVLPSMFPEDFSPIDQYMGLKPGTSGDWVRQYGLIRDPKNAGALPVGFVLSHHRPGSGAPSPIEFVALSCAACHSYEVQLDPAKPGPVVYGTGNQSMNLLAFVEAFRAVLLRRADPAREDSAFVLTMETVAAARDMAGLPAMTTVERLAARLWLSAARTQIGEYQRVVDEPLAAHQFMNPAWLPAGPGRTQPFRSTVREHLDRPGNSSRGAQPDQGFSKIPLVYLQDRKYHGDWSQYDGSIGDYVVRSTLAAATAGANVHNLARPDLAANIRLSAEWTLDAKAPTWQQVFGSAPPGDAQTLALGKDVYRRECFSCHGAPDGNGLWTGQGAAQFGEVILLSELGTDPERLAFRHAARVPRVVTAKFHDYPKTHPLSSFKEADLRANIDDQAGYYAGPIEGAFLRAPYLHNGSILTLKELIGLAPREKRFYRGRNAYDMDAVGLKSPKAPPTGDKPHDADYYYLFDTDVRGNSNAGHSYPAWAFPKDGASGKAPALTPDQTKELTALLEYLKTL